MGKRGKPVVFGDQTNIVIWDEVHQIEHFIRNAKFQSNASDFGFIAPTPSKPQLSEASIKAFYTLARLKPARKRMSDTAKADVAPKTMTPAVQVIQEIDVAGYHATTLLSSDAHAINDWMNQHGYVSTPDVEKWAERYAAKRWYLTAFKVTDKTKLEASTGTVRMSFKTDKPFNPFYVPESNINSDHKGTLLVYFVPSGNYDAKIGNTESWQTPQWTADIPPKAADLLAKQIKLPKSAIPEGARVATFVDYDFPRPAKDDIYFTKNGSLSPKEFPSRSSQMIIAYATSLLFTGLVLLALVKRPRPAV